jgi:hypothetical protein
VYSLYFSGVEFDGIVGDFYWAEKMGAVVPIRVNPSLRAFVEAVDVYQGRYNRWAVLPVGKKNSCGLGCC